MAGEVEQRLAGGSFYGAVAGRLNAAGAIFSELRHDRARKLPVHSHDMPFFCLFLDGDYGEEYRRRYLQFKPFTLSFRPAAVPHMDEVGPKGAHMFGIEIQSDWQELLQSESGNLEIAYDTDGGDKLWLALKLYHETRGNAMHDSLVVESLIAELLAHTACTPDRSHNAPYWLRRVQDKLRAEFCHSLTLSKLAEEAGVHPVHLSRSFRRFIGSTLGEYVQRLRLRRACELMMNPDLSLADVGYMASFSDQSHFTRTCNAITGLTPGRLRSVVREFGPACATVKSG